MKQKRNKFTDVFRQKVVLEYLNGNQSMPDLMKKYGIKGSSCITNWIRKFELINLTERDPELKSQMPNSQKRTTIEQYQESKIRKLEEQLKLEKLKTEALGTLIDIAEEKLLALDNYARNIGLSFQIKDDILDIESNTQILGKQQGADIELNKVTYPAILGLDGAKKMAQQCHQRALESLVDFDQDADPLRWLSEYIIIRQH